MYDIYSLQTRPLMTLYSISFLPEYTSCLHDGHQEIHKVSKFFISKSWNIDYISLSTSSDVKFNLLTSDQLCVAMIQRPKSSQNTELLTFWSEILRARSSDLPNIALLVEISLDIPTNSVECERRFSQMKMTRTDWSAKLGVESLASLMFVSLNCGETVTDYKPDKAMKLWWLFRNRNLSNGPSQKISIRPLGSPTDN